ncbi:TPA: 16S rRNA (cytosine(1402)-N(4))-methyltransferase [Candidatus Collierbacteria bacterium]|uniref:Ribosomal RNA small subunit methyltransferase H n=1 Tax=Candidatus Collierbacteria bacterium GW2011_GWB2_44_22 TaxID=1618387 RepID=A0A0G1HXA8_9BACT|nr:MAG: Ribosomal RNA small subunit methyltransferase H [Candidatus Collierbacteria bacterium GW2011_GWA2_44_13]KKT51123.1 MAG: Ribosomal RNA small subunit methyltransferase H [Candidatus Collierbacteria bacterium GW2011_GWB1_44_197]KKT51570.1 MAG: Ribosomal RNA small subunit methyltransferase H [Candidatus Collierbacteria bacterium GW2011_GWB2_44_22]KKT63022.1 MAG: Ribosomal RNA small subunit methyltransferase H [Candidatus Collierbacteria bacterium GW2011_GWD1_44_27]KKT65833.1 MAG: Ribosomal 
MTNLIERHFPAYKGELKKLYGFKSGYLFLDLTLGDGGHTQEALEAGCRVVSFDIDEKAIQRATGYIKNFRPIIIDGQDEMAKIPQNFVWVIIKSNFTQVSEICKRFSLSGFDGIMTDLGPSQFQVLSEGRGFSFLLDEPLDMRLNQSLGVTAADLLAVLNEGELVELFSLADEPFAKPIARIIAKQRQVTPVITTKQLSDIITRIKKFRTEGRIHPATKVFMALRMAVNLERENIRLLLPQLPNLLKKNGILGVISFHSGEDKLVKDFIDDSETKGILSAINQKPIEPSIKELSISQRTRSAKLRLAKKII